MSLKPWYHVCVTVEFLAFGLFTSFIVILVVRLSGFWNMITACNLWLGPSSLMLFYYHSVCCVRGFSSCSITRVLDGLSSFDDHLCLQVLFPLCGKA